MNIKHFINLTNGIEAIPKIPKEDINFIRIQSTTLEKKDWYKLFMELDHNLLMWLVLGAECRIYDFGCNRPLSKTIYTGIPIIEYCLNRFWFGYDSPTVWLGRCRTNSKEYVVSEIYKKYFMYYGREFLDKKKTLDTKLKYYNKYIDKINGINKINIIGISESTCHDSNTNYYRKILNTLMEEK